MDEEVGKSLGLQFPQAHPFLPSQPPSWSPSPPWYSAPRCDAQETGVLQHLAPAVPFLLLRVCGLQVSIFNIFPCTFPKRYMEAPFVRIVDYIEIHTLLLLHWSKYVNWCCKINIQSNILRCQNLWVWNKYLLSNKKFHLL